MSIHDHLHQWVRVDQERETSPSEAIIDSQSVKTAAIVSEQVGFDAGKRLKGRKRFLTVDTLGLVLRVLVTAASVGEREGGKRVLKRVNRMGFICVAAAHHLGCFLGQSICPKTTACRWRVRRQSVPAVGDGCVPLDCAGRAQTGADQRLCLA